MKNSLILIPSYEPLPSIVPFVKTLKEDGYDVIAVDDGSGRNYRNIFEQLKEYATVLSYEENHGKGYALKYGIGYAKTHFPNTDTVITADGDCQHLPKDIEHIARIAQSNQDPKLILGTRDFKQANVPLRSRFGNGFSSLYFRIVTGKECPDTQTGLRAIPRELFNLALNTPGDRYEFEMNFLMSAAKVIDLQFVDIETVYEDHNSSSHFNTVRDSVRIYRSPLRFIASSLMSACVDLAMFAVLSLRMIPMSATIIARIISGIFNFTLNRFWTFNANEGNPAVQGVKYLILFICQMLLSGTLVTIASYVTSHLTIAKAVIDVTLSVLSWYVQKTWVFKEEAGIRLKEG